MSSVLSTKRSRQIVVGVVLGVALIATYIYGWKVILADHVRGIYPSWQEYAAGSFTVIITAIFVALIIYGFYAFVYDVVKKWINNGTSDASATPSDQKSP